MATYETITVNFQGNEAIQIQARHTDDLPLHVKGAAQWRSDACSGPGYFIPATFTSTHIPEPVEFLNNAWYGLFYEHRRLWTRASSAIPQRHNTFGLGFWGIHKPEHPDYQPPAEQSSTSAQQIEIDTIDPPELPQHPDPTIDAIAAGLDQVASLQGTLPLDPPTTMSADATVTAPAPAPAPTSGSLKGVAPSIFSGDRSRSETFLNDFVLYQMINRNNESMKIPFYRVLMALSYIKGPLVEDWVTAQAQKLANSIDTTKCVHLLEDDELLWTNFETAFKNTWRDTVRSQSAYDQLINLRMRDLDIDTYTATFERLASAAGWEPNAQGTIAHYRTGLRDQVHRRILLCKHMPTDMDEWKEAARREVNRIRKFYNAGLSGNCGNQRARDQHAYQSNQRQNNTLRNNSNSAHVPMDVDNAIATLPFQKLTDDERAQYRAEGRCFRCRLKGHLAWDCPKNSNQRPNPNARAASTSTLADTATPTPPPPPPKPAPKLTKAQQIHTIKESMNDEERGEYFDSRDMGEDFCDARL